MADHSAEDHGDDKTADSRQKEHERRNELQAELLRQAHDRSRHGAFVDAALRRARGDQEKKDDHSGHR